MSSKIVSKTKKRSFFKDIHLGGAVKVFFILLIILIVFFCIWVLIKPSKNRQIIGVSALPSEGVIIPADDSKCGTDIIPCSGYSCEQSCPSGTGTSNYSCQKVKSDVFYLGTKLPIGQSFCLPREMEPVVKDCGTYTGRVVEVSTPNGGYSWDCICKYPNMFGGPDCTQQLVCSYTDYDENGNPVSKNGKLMKVDENGIPILTGGNTGTRVYYDYDTTEDSSPVDVYNNDVNKPVWICECPPGYISLPNDPYSCHRDPCYAGQGSSSSQFDPKTNSCVCGPNTYKSNIDGFCYPLDMTSNQCIPSYNNLCTAGFLGEWINTDGTKVNLMFRYGGNVYIVYGLPKQSDDKFTFFNYNDWLFAQQPVKVINMASDMTKFDLQGGSNFGTINCSVSGNTITYNILDKGTCTSSKNVDIFNNYNLSCTGASISRTYIISPSGTTGTGPVNTFVTAVQIYPSPQLQKDFPGIYNGIQGIYNNIVSLDGSKLEDWVNILGIATYDQVSQMLQGNTSGLITAIENSYNAEAFTVAVFVAALNSSVTNPYGLIPQFCNSIYSIRKDKNGKLYLDCDDNSFKLGPNSILADMYNPTGVVGADYRNPDYCGSKTDFGIAELDPFVPSGINCLCNSGYKIDPLNPLLCIRDCKASGDDCDTNTECCTNDCVARSICTPDGCSTINRCA